jgi:hypothetical protein
VTNLQSTANENAAAAAAATQAAPSSSAPQPQVHTVVATPSASVNLLDWDDEPQPVRSAPTVSAGLRLGQIDLSPAEFQQRWGTLPEVLSQKLFTLAMVPDATSEVESSMRAVMVSPHPPSLSSSSTLIPSHRSTPWHLALYLPLLE